jgi:MotA/TolQ/ExbB proton channel family
MISNLRWWLIFICSVAGLIFATASGHVGAMWRIDMYKISFVTLATYFLVTVFIGRLTWRISHGDLAWHLRYQEGYDYAVTLMTMLGLIGTVIGFMGLLATSFSSLASADVSMAKGAIGALTSGSSTALVNTLVGLVGAVGLKLQVINLNLAAHRDQ